MATSRSEYRPFGVAVMRIITNDSGGEVPSQGRVHMGLAATYLRNPTEAYGRLEVMASGRSMYSSMFSRLVEVQAFLDGSG